MLENQERDPPYRRARFSRPPERLLFLRRWLAHPLRVGSVLPSSSALGRLVVEQLPDPGRRFVLEVGPGTGAITRALLRVVPEEQLLLAELDEELCQWLRGRFPRATVLCGDAIELDRLLPGACRDGNIAAIVSGMPVIQVPTPAKRAFVERGFAAMMPEGRLLQYSYLPVPPLPFRQLGIEASRVGAAFGSGLPVFLWRYTRSGG